MVWGSNVVGNMDDCKIEPASTTKGHQFSDVIVLDFPENGECPATRPKGRCMISNATNVGQVTLRRFYAKWYSFGCPI